MFEKRGLALITVLNPQDNPRSITSNMENESIVESLNG